MFVMAHLSRWLTGECLDASGLTPQVAGRFLTARRAAGYTLYLSPKVMSCRSLQTAGGSDAITAPDGDTVVCPDDGGAAAPAWLAEPA
jgi:hypothetical protein